MQLHIRGFNTLVLEVQPQETIAAVKVSKQMPILTIILGKGSFSVFLNSAYRIVGNPSDCQSKILRITGFRVYLSVREPKID